MKIAALLMIKNEVSLLKAWLTYHAHLIGAKNLFIFDNGSISAQTISILEEWKGSLGCCELEYNTELDYINKPQIYIDKIRELELLGYEFFFPMDCDEFLAVEMNGVVSIDSSAIFETLVEYRNEQRVLRIKRAYDNSPIFRGLYNPSSQRKCFFYTGSVLTSDHGFHDSQSKLFGHEFVSTQVVYLHHHFRPIDDYRRAALEKLSPWLKDFSPESLLKFKGPGHHLTPRLLRTDLDYYILRFQHASASNAVRIDPFVSFIEERDLPGIFPEPQIQHFFRPSLEWIHHIDTFEKLGPVIRIIGWGFNENSSELSMARLWFNDQLFEPLSFKLIERGDVLERHPAAVLLSGFCVEFDVQSLLPLYTHASEPKLYLSDTEDQLGYGCRLSAFLPRVTDSGEESLL